ncbi:MAG: hypothetical protein ACD_77C00248G0001 [uncultured bacterium]|nr:MAG: hypothetical protein ACD_77C00248G0001 [uncultured bacterium]
MTDNFSVKFIAGIISCRLKVAVRVSVKIKFFDLYAINVEFTSPL